MALDPKLRPNLSRAEPDAIARKRRTRNIALAIALFALVALFYAISVVKLGHPVSGAH